MSQIFTSADLRLPLPRARGPEGLQSWDLSFPMKSIAVAGTLPDDVTAVEGPDASGQVVPGFFKVAAAYIQSCPMTREEERDCGRFPVAVNDCFSRVAWWLQNVQNTPGASVNPASALPFPVDFLVRVANNCNAETVFSGTIHLTSFLPNTNSGLLVQRGGLLGTQVEFWARCRPGSLPVDVCLALKCDRIGDRNQTILGKLVTGGP